MPIYLTSDTLLTGLLLLSGAILCFSVRYPFAALLPMRFESGLPPGDMAGLQTKIEDMRRRRWVGYDVPDSVVPGIHPYPVFFHWLLSRFPRRYWRTVSVNLNILPDFLAGAAAYFLTMHAFETMAVLEASSSLARPAAAFSLYLAVTMPILMPATSRLQSTNGRTFGLLLAQMEIVSVFVAVQSNDVTLLLLSSAIAVGLTVLTVLTSMFNLQVILFLSVPLSILLLDPTPVLAAAVGLAISWMCPMIGARQVLEFKWHHWRWYRGLKADTRTTASGRSLIVCFWTFLRTLPRQPNRALSTLMRESPVVITVISAPLLMAIAITIAIDPSLISFDSAMLDFSMAVVVAAGIIFASTATRALSEWGQAERYWEVAVPVIASMGVVLPIALWGAEWGFGLALVVLALQIVTVVRQHIFRLVPVKRYLREFPNDDREREVVEFLKSVSGDMRLLTLPQQLQRYWTRFTRWDEAISAKFYYTMLLSRDEKSGKAFSYFAPYYRDSLQYPSVPAQKMAKDFGITHVIVLNRFADNNRKRSDFITSLFDDGEKLFDNGKYSVWRIRRGATTPKES